MELVQLYHNRTLHAVTGVSVELLFARFAWSIFTDTVVTFFRGMQEFSVLVDTFQIILSQSECQPTETKYRRGVTAGQYDESMVGMRW